MKVASRPWWVLFCSSFGMVSLAVAVNLMPVLLTTLQTALGGDRPLTNEQLGRIGGVTFFGLVVGILVTGPLADRVGLKPFALLGNGLIGLGAGGLVLSHDYATLLAAVFAMGLGAGILDMVLSPIVAVAYPRATNRAMNVLHSFYCIGAVITTVAGAVALRSGADWRQIAGGLAILPVVGAGLFVMTRVGSLLGADERRQPAGELLLDRRFRWCLAAIFLGGATELGMAQWLPAYAEKTLGYSAWVGGMSLTAFSLAMAVGRLGIAVLPAGWTPMRVMRVCCWLTVVFFILGCFAPWPAVALGGCVLAGLSGSSLWPSMLAVAVERFPRGGATMFGLLGALGNAGGIAMPWLVGVVADVADLRWGLATAIACPVAMLVALGKVEWQGGNETEDQAGSEAERPVAVRQ